MARTFRRKHTAQPIAELNLTNLIDLGFTLLIIFMIATPLINKEQTIPVSLPTESKSAQPKPDKNTKFHALSIDATGRFYLDDKTSALTLEQLKTQLRAYAGEKDKPTIRLRLDAKTTAQQFITVMDELKKLALTSITFDTQTGR